MLRTASLYSRVLEGLNMDFDRALKLLRNHNDFTTLQDKEERDILVAAIDNLVEFAAAEEYVMMDDILKYSEDEGFEDYEGICERYNLTYAETENEQVLYAAWVAGWWINQSSDALITYMTQGDERVRESHQALEGLTFTKSNFPSDLIPPIDWRCRCYLLSGSNEASASAFLKTDADYRKKVNPVFAESLAMKGRIFSESHPYFTSAYKKNRKVQTIIRKLKNKLLCRK
nr:MAG TPA: minor capsid component [Caudoviricetes sp.]